MENFFYCGPAVSPEGLVGIEMHGDVALLRSLVVAGACRSSGVRSALVAQAEDHARAMGARALYLLTTTAEDFFRRRGYITAAREGAPPAIRQSREFADLCPESSAFMVKNLERVYNVLFLCTGNSARSILAESLVNHWGRGKFRGFSAGSHPKGQVHPIAVALLQKMKLPSEGFRSKSWDEFAVAGAPALDFVFTVCDTAAGEVCPYWPGQPMTAHWGVEDPAAVEGSDVEKWLAFRQVFSQLENRVKVFTSLPIATLDRTKLKERLDAIG